VYESGALFVTDLHARGPFGFPREKLVPFPEPSAARHRVATNLSGVIGGIGLARPWSESSRAKGLCGDPGGTSIPRRAIFG